MPTRTSATLIIALLLGSPALWSANHLVARWAADFLAPHALTLGRWSVAAILFVALFGATLKRDWSRMRPDPAVRPGSGWRSGMRTALADCFVLAVLGIWISGVSVYYGARTTPAANIGLIYSLSPVFVALLAAFTYRDRVSARQIGGITLALTGVVAIILKGELRGLQHVAWTPGDLWIVLAAIAWALYSVRLRYRPSALDANARLTCVILCGVVVMLPLASIEAVWVGLPEFSGRALAAVLILGIVAGFGAYVTYSWLIAAVGPTRTAVVLYLIPPYNALLAWLLLDEPIERFHLVGGALILLGVYLVNRPSPGASKSIE